MERGERVEVTLATVKGELRCETMRVAVSGRTLGLMLWLAAHQKQLNALGEASGQLWLTWKGLGPLSVDGEVKVRLT